MPRLTEICKFLHDQVQAKPENGSLPTLTMNVLRPNAHQPQCNVYVPSVHEASKYEAIQPKSEETTQELGPQTARVGSPEEGTCERETSTDTTTPTNSIIRTNQHQARVDVEQIRYIAYQQHTHSTNLLEANTRSYDDRRSPPILSFCY